MSFISQAMKPKSDQLNADDLVVESIIVKIVDVAQGSAEQPVVVHITGGHKPWKPNKGTIRVLASQWGDQKEDWIGQCVELYRKEDVDFGSSKNIGGIRVAGLTGISKPTTVMVTERRGRKSPHTLQPLVIPSSIDQFGSLDIKAKRKYWSVLDEALQAEIKSKQKDQSAK